MQPAQQPQPQLQYRTAPTKRRPVTQHHQQPMGALQQQQPALNGKDLIIRMLAEVFQVNQLEDGQVKWQQVSSSLVPVSLYSRTTSRWLNFLLAANSSSSMAAASSTASAMSPDSRDFLLLLQQFHQQQQIDEMLVGGGCGSSGQTAANPEQLIVFQVVAHDYFECQCRKIMNVKIAQPGTRLGQASDYFVYWKERGSNHNQYPQVPIKQQSSSFTSFNNNQSQSQGCTNRSQISSNNLPVGGYNNNNNNNRNNQIQFSDTLDQSQNFNQAQQQATANCCFTSGDSTSTTQTWGLNFASVNDAKLFYDICSLNLVDLNFNSEYLKQLAAGNGSDIFQRIQQQLNPLARHQPTTIARRIADPQQRGFSGDSDPNQFNRGNQITQQASGSHNKQQQASVRDLLRRRAAAGDSNRQLRQQQVANHENQMKRQLSGGSKCQSCKRVIQQQQLPVFMNSRQRYESHQLNDQQAACPIHRPEQQQRSVRRQRSRSSTRHQETAATGEMTGAGGQNGRQGAGLKRARSHSTPASPERLLLPEVGQQQQQQQPQWSVHQTGSRRQLELEQEQQQLRTTGEPPHHPRCLNFIKQQMELSNRKQQQSIEEVRPKKPVRGVLRDSSSAGSRSRDGAPAVPLRNSSMSADRQQKSIVKSEDVEPEDKQLQVEPSNNDQTSDNQESGGQKFAISPEFESRRRQFLEDQQAAAQFVKSRASQRRSTTSGAHLQRELLGAGSRGGKRDAQAAEAAAAAAAAAAHRDASLARAQYANSKNMKEFLSLDAGGQQQQTTPTQLATLNERFLERHQQHQQEAPQTGEGQRRPPQSSLSSSVHSNEQVNCRMLVTSALDKGLAAAAEVGGELAASKSGNSEEDDAMHNVGTTTDDLPLDSSTKRRMFKLTSEEVISERTEPRSLSTPSLQFEAAAANESGNNPMPTTYSLQHFGHQQTTTTRAASLGPSELRSMRSEAGNRRRSLERSTCIDLGEQPATGGLIKQAPSYKLRQLYHKQYPCSSQRPQPANCVIQPKRQRTRSSNLEGACCGSQNTMEASDCCYEDENLNNPLDSWHCAETGSHLRPQRLGPEVCDRQRMASCKSAPDMSSLSQCPPHHHNRHPPAQYHAHSHHHHAISNQPEMNDLYLDQQAAIGGDSWHNHPGRMTQPEMGRGISPTSCEQRLFAGGSYAVPLFEPSENNNRIMNPNYGRQSQSCPNSLRRQPARYMQQLDLQQLAGLSSHDAAAGSGRFRCHLCSSVWPTGRGSSKRLPAGGCDCCGEQPACGRPVSIGGRPQSHRASARCAAGQWRPCSQASSRQSPLQFGLYESDVDDQEYYNENRAEDYCDNPVGCQLDTFDQPEVPMQQVHGCRAVVNQFCKGHGQLQMQLQPLNDEPVVASHVDFRSSQRLPVQGYDQTMARASSLRSRQRARSQPPPQETGHSNRVDHREQEEELAEQLRLNRSMENVQKLIREVQNELSLMKGAGGCCPMTNIAPAQREPQDSEPQATGQRLRQGAGANLVKESSSAAQLSVGRQRLPSLEATVKMSIEERAATGHRISLHHHQPANDHHQLVQSAGDAITSSSATRRAGQFKCVGAIRKAGFLSVKKWILKRRQSIELARKQGWKRYWVCLRGTALLFHSVIDCKEMGQKLDDADHENCTDLLAWLKANCCSSNQSQLIASLMQQSEAGNLLLPQPPEANDHQSDKLKLNPSNKQRLSREAFLQGMSQCFIEKEPRHLIIVEGAIVQPIPEHPKRDFVFCLSTTFGDAYLFQASCQLESDNWIAAIHNACAASLARDLTRDEAAKLFEAKVRHLELEAEKKLFLRQRLESRLTTMSSISGFQYQATGNSATDFNEPNDNLSDAIAGTNREQDCASKKAQMRTLLQRLHHQLVALDNYIEQVHCEIYQLRCYLSSCGAQQLFYQSLQSQSQAQVPVQAASELPHPKSLLMHVSKPTKLMLIRLGVFTVSSFHAFIHARQGSADTILHRLQQAAVGGQKNPMDGDAKKPLEFRVQAIGSREENKELESNTEQLIDEANLRLVSVRLTKQLVVSIRRQVGGLQKPLANAETIIGELMDSDDRQSIQDEGGDFLAINLKLHSNSSAMCIIKRILSIVCNSNDAIDKLAFLNYYLRFKPKGQSDRGEDEELSYSIAKRRETLSDWSNFEYLELMERLVFRVQLIRRRMDEESALSSPYGISIGAYLFTSGDSLESQLNVYCQYIEWGSAADKAGLRDEDELLVANGIPVQDLDMMFVECIMQDDHSLRLVVRSSRLDYPQNSEPLDPQSWRPPTGDSDRDGNDGRGGVGGHIDQSQTEGATGSSGQGSGAGNGAAGGSQVISDEYISSLVCPPPPTKSSAFLRENGSLLRQKSDLGQEMGVIELNKLDKDDKQRLTTSSSSKSQQNLILFEELIMNKQQQQQPVIPNQQQQHSPLALDLDLLIQSPTKNLSTVSAEQLAKQLLKRTSQLTQLLAGRNPAAANEDLSSNKEENSRVENKQESAQTNNGKKFHLLDPNSLERLRKSILELLETEYAYIRHLETIGSHYMAPLEDGNYLSIGDLRHLSQIVQDLIVFQREFFEKLTGSLWLKCDQLMASSRFPIKQAAQPSKLTSSHDDDQESEELNKILQQLEQFRSMDQFKHIILTLARTFIDESEGFKIYGAYCVAYSKLQKFLHPKKAQVSPNVLIPNAPNVLDTFVGSIAGGSQHRDFLKPLGSFMSQTSGSSHDKNGASVTGNSNNSSLAVGNQDFGQQLRQLSDFLGNLDSSSSSASLSLPASRSSSSSVSAELQKKSSKVMGGSTSNGCNSTNVSTSSTSSANGAPFQRSVHQQNFESYLIKPIQRIVKYPMLMNSIAVSALHILNADSEDQLARKELDTELQEAVKQMGAITSYVNDTQRIHDEFGKTLDQIERLFLSQLHIDSILLSKGGTGHNLSQAFAPMGPHQPAISLSIENLLHFGPVEWLNINEFTQSSKLKVSPNSQQFSQMLFVFNSCVVFICKEQLKLSSSSSSFATNQLNSNATSNKKTKLSVSTNVISNSNNSSNNNNNQGNNNNNNSLTSSNNNQQTTATNHHHGMTSSSKAFQKCALEQTSSAMIRYQSLIPVSEVQVRSVPSTNAQQKNQSATNRSSTTTNQLQSQHPYQWELFRCSSVNSNSNLLTKSNRQGKVYLLASPSNEARNAFLRKIRLTIRESVRNMSLPLARTPSSKSLTPKKISSPSSATATNNSNSSCSHSTSLSPVCTSGELRGAKGLGLEAGEGVGEFSTAVTTVTSQVCDSNSYKNATIKVNN